jgi:hypothetical protein
MSVVRRLSTCTLALLLCLTALSVIHESSASADLNFEAAEFDLIGSDGSFTRQAGSHADFRTFFSFPFDPDAEIGGEPWPGPTEAPHTIEVDLPPGMVGNLVGVPTCSPADLASPSFGASKCPIGSQLGVAEVTITLGGPEQTGLRGVYNIAHGPEVPARLGFNYYNVVVLIDAHVRPRDYGVSSGTATVSQGEAFRKTKLTLWGVPADPSHDRLRAPEGGFVAAPPGGEQPFAVPSPVPPTAFLSLPTSCEDTPASFTIRGDSWEHRGIFDVRTLTADSESTPFVFDGCEKLPFSPTASVQPRSHAAESPTGLDLDLEVPQSNGPKELVTAHVRQVKMTFPKGMTVSSSSATGLDACSESQIDLDTVEAPQCPGSSKLGTVLIDTPVLSEQLQGSIYLARQYANPFDSLLALYIAVKGPGFYLKLPGKAELDPVTGQLTTLFDETPQLPFSKMQVQLKDGPRSALSTPRKCGTYTIRTEFRSWAQPDAPVVSDSSFKVDEGCGSGGFSPKLSAGTTDATAGDSSSFVLRVTRADGEQNLAGIDVTLPEGLLAKLAGVPLCGDAAAATGDCPAASQVGRTTVGAGSGPNPVYVPEAGKAPTAAYLAGPYKGAPFSIVVKVPAQAGPFDLGTVAVRSGIYVDPVTARASVKSDALPQILQGIPIAYRDVRVEIDRPGFIQNPTGCEAMKVESTIHGSDGATASPAASFKATDCGLLGFKPKLALKFTGPTHRSAYPALKATLTMPKGGANIGKAVVTLPKTEFLENAHIRTVCTRVQYAADDCPKGSVYGYAKAFTPLLDKPLQGPVYLRSSSHELPDLVASLDGQIHVDLAGRIDSVNERLRNTFWAVPDAPVSKFVLTMQGGKKGLLVNNTELCKARPRAKASFVAQNGKSSVRNPLVKIACGKRDKKGR